MPNDDHKTTEARGYTLEAQITCVRRCYFHVSEAHLHRYAAEFDFRHNHRERLGYDDVERADVALRGVAGKRLTYQTTRRQIALDTPPPF